MKIHDFIKEQHLSFARKAVADNPRLRSLGCSADTYPFHYRVGIKKGEKVALFYVSKRAGSVPTNIEILHALAFEARVLRVPDGELAYAQRLAPASGLRQRLQKRADGLRNLLGDEAFTLLTTKVIL